MKIEPKYGWLDWLIKLVTILFCGIVGGLVGLVLSLIFRLIG